MAWGDANNQQPHHPRGWWRLLAALENGNGLPYRDPAYWASLVGFTIRSDHWWGSEAYAILHDLWLTYVGANIFLGASQVFSPHTLLDNNNPINAWLVMPDLANPAAWTVIGCWRNGSSRTLSDYYRGILYTSPSSSPFYEQRAAGAFPYSTEPLDVVSYTLNFSNALAWPERGQRTPSPRP